MAARRKDDEAPVSRRRPPDSPQAFEDRLITKSMRLAERQLDEGTASAQVQVHYLRLGSSREKLEQERLRGEVSLNRIKEETLASEKRIEEKIDAAMDALKSYSPTIYGGEEVYDEE